MDQSSTMAARRSLNLRLRALAGQRAVWPLLALALILIVDGFVSPGFFTDSHRSRPPVRQLDRHMYRGMPTAMVALGMAVVIGTKGIDLSVGSVIAVVRRHDRLAHPRGRFAFRHPADRARDRPPLRRVERLPGRRPRHPADHRHADPDGVRARHRPDDQPDLRRHQSELREPIAAGPQRRAYRPDSDPVDLGVGDLRSSCGC